MKKWRAILLVILVMNIIDIVSTWSLVQNYGLMAECNPIMVYFFRIGPGAAFSFKAIMIIMFTVIAWLNLNRNLKILNLGILLVLFFYSIVTMMHWYIRFS